MKAPRVCGTIATAAAARKSARAALAASSAPTVQVAVHPGGGRGMPGVGIKVRPWLLAAAVVAIDQVTKALVERAIPGGGGFAALGGIVHVTHVRNPGSAFGVFGSTTVPVLVSVLVAVWWVGASLTGAVRRYGSAFEVGSALVLGGAVGNLIDRVRVGCVIDFIDFRVWPVFNLADAAITAGALLVVYAMVRGRIGGRNSE
ncbi:MAG: signal peptidase II [Bacillota bacterium]